MTSTDLRHQQLRMDWQPGLAINPDNFPLPPFVNVSAAGKAAGLQAERKKKITRTRTSYSCHECRKRKIKCDKVHPTCGNCLKAGESCTYDKDAVPEQPAPQDIHDPRHGVKRPRDPLTPAKSNLSDSPSANSTGQSGTGEASLESRINRLTSLVDALRRDKISQNGPSAVENGAGRDGEYGDAGFRRSSSVSSQGRGSDIDREKLSRALDEALRTGVVHSGSDLNELKLKYLSLSDRDGERFGGGPFFAYVAEELDQVNQLLRRQNTYVSAASTLTSHCNGVHDRPALDTGLSDTEPEDDQEEDSSSGDSKPKHPSRSDCASCQKLAAHKSVLLRSRPPKPHTVTETTEDLLQHLPTNRQSNILFRFWYSGVHGVIPVLSPPDALLAYKLFWNWYENRHVLPMPLPEREYMPMLYAIWYAGSTVVPTKVIRSEFGISRAELSTMLHEYCVKWLSALAFPRRTSLQSFGAYLLINSLTRDDDPLTNSSYLGLAVRVAQSMGLHRDPETFNLPTQEAEIRRRMWWHIIQVDTALAISSGLPPIVSDDSSWDVRPICELKDNYLGTSEGDAYIKDVDADRRSRDDPTDPALRNSQSMVDVHYVVARTMHWYSSQMRKILKIELGTRRISQQDMSTVRTTLAAIESRVKEVTKRIPSRGIPELGFFPDSKRTSQIHLSPDILATDTILADLQPFMGAKSAGKQSAAASSYHWKALADFHKSSRILLSMMVDKAYSLAYAPFLKQADSRLWNTARQCALHHCHGYFRKFISLATDREFQLFPLTSPMCQQSVHASIILLVDLHERPTSVEAPSSRAYIDRMHALRRRKKSLTKSEDEPIMQRPLREGGLEARAMLKHLRAMGWRKAGLDPSVFWTEEKQIEIGIAKPLNPTERLLQSIREDSIVDHNGVPGESDVPAETWMDLEGVQDMMRVVAQNGSAMANKKRRTQPTTVAPPPAAAPPNVPPSLPGATDWSPPPIPQRQLNIHPVSHKEFIQNGYGSMLGQHDSHVPPSVGSATSDSGSGLGTHASSGSPGGTDATSVTNGGKDEVFSSGEPTMETVFDWEAWDAVFGQQPSVDEMFWDQGFSSDNAVAPDIDGFAPNLV